MGKVFPHLSRRKLKAALFQPLILEPEDPERHRARVAAERREAERIQAERHRRMLERSAARVLHSAPTGPKDQSDRDADWFVAHPDRNHRVRRKVEGEIPPHLDWGCKWVVVRQLEPGLRLRMGFNIKVNSRALRDFADDETGAAFVFETIAADPEAQAIRATDVDNAFEEARS
jgi:hypothetical protein